MQFVLYHCFFEALLLPDEILLDPFLGVSRADDLAGGMSAYWARFSTVTLAPGILITFGTFSPLRMSIASQSAAPPMPGAVISPPRFHPRRSRQRDSPFEKELPNRKGDCG
jgi:hypothetical protein